LTAVLLTGSSTQAQPSRELLPQSTLLSEQELEAAVSDGSLVWSADSHTVDPDSINEGIYSMTAAVAAELKEEGLIR
jgi:hypothetical protein